MKNLWKVLFTLVCLSSGYGFYKMNPQDPLVAVAFTVGILGIGYSLFRRAS